jgi:DNA-binding MarR family transcriptional regulator
VIDLVDHLLAHRHRIPNRSVLDVLALVRFGPSTSRRYSWRELAEVFGVVSRPYVTQKLRLLERLGLLSYEPGTYDEPGYLIHRVGLPIPASTSDARQ